MAEMMTTGIGLGDAMLLGRQGWNNYDGYNQMWNNPIWAMAFLNMMNGGFWNRNGADYVSQANLAQGLDNQDKNGQLRGISYGLADVGYALNNAVKDSGYATRDSMGAGFSGIHNDIDKVNYTMMENRFANQAGIADVKNAIQNLGFVNEQNTCKITTALHAEGEATRAMIAQQTVDALKGELAKTSQALQDAKFANSQMAQNQYLIDKLGNNGCGCNC